MSNRGHRNWSGRRGSNSQLSAWEAEFPILYFQHLQNQLEKMYMHALHAVHALPDLRVAGGRLGRCVAFISHAGVLVRDEVQSR